MSAATEPARTDNNAEHVKCVVVGDGAVGKTALLMTFTSGEFPAEYIPTICDNFRQTLDVDGKSVSLSLWDTAGQESYERLRPMSYRGADVFVMCFSTMNQSSYDNIPEKWIPEIRHHRPDTPILLVGTKTDMRDNPDEESRRVAEQQHLTPVPREKGEELAKRTKCIKYMECSAKTEKNIRAVFEEAVRIHWNNLNSIQSGVKTKKRTCAIL